MILPLPEPICLPETIPEQFPFPFRGEPHPLARRAAEDLKLRLMERTWQHDFGLSDESSPSAIGKMFGVLVVQDQAGKLGYLSAFSGRLEGSYVLEGFVPAVYDLYGNRGFFAAGEAELTAINARVEQLESAADRLALLADIERMSTRADTEIAELKARQKRAKAQRRAQREQALPEQRESLQARHREESSRFSFALRKLRKMYQSLLGRRKAWLDLYDAEIKRLKEERRRQSAALQKRIFDQYRLLNAAGESRSLQSIFEQTALGYPPAGAGECCAPKLLQYAFAQRLQPVCMAEFWWGRSPSELIRHHARYYPACRAKCAPILDHMLAATPVCPDPLLLQADREIPLPIVYEDDYLLAVDKPGGLLSVPGREIADSVWLRLKNRRPNEPAPLSVHRLDMATSGLLLLAKNAEVHARLQKQFADRKVHKCYHALLHGQVLMDSGTVELPLRPDYLERPLQVVDHQKGKWAKTFFRVLKRRHPYTWVELIPHTGRTHQLRIHAAHAEGLNAPIVGDALYGKVEKKLCLRAVKLSFEHPVSGQEIKLQLDTTDFDGLMRFTKNPTSEGH